MLRLETQRDRTILYLATTAAVLLLSVLGLKPQLESYRDIGKKYDKEQQKQKDNNTLINKSRTEYRSALDNWMKAGVNRSGEIASSSTGSLISNYSENLRLTFDQLNTQSTNVRSQKNRDYPQNIVRARGTGSYNQILTFLYHLANDTNPLRVTEVDMTAKDDDPRFMTFNMLVATTFYSPDTRRSRTSAAGVAVAGSGSSSEVQP
jgi:hypothetical protein